MAANRKWKVIFSIFYDVRLLEVINHRECDREVKIKVRWIDNPKWPPTGSEHKYLTSFYYVGSLEVCNNREAGWDVKIKVGKFLDPIWPPTGSKNENLCSPIILCHSRLSAIANLVERLKSRPNYIFIQDGRQQEVNKNI